MKCFRPVTIHLHFGKFLRECHLRPEGKWGHKCRERLLEPPLERWMHWAGGEGEEGRAPGAGGPGRRGLRRGATKDAAGMGEAGEGVLWGQTPREFGVSLLFESPSVK